jgi:hypothetical protein
MGKFNFKKFTSRYSITKTTNGYTLTERKTGLTDTYSIYGEPTMGTFTKRSFWVYDEQEVGDTLLSYIQAKEMSKLEAFIETI